MITDDVLRLQRAVNVLHNARHDAVGFLISGPMHPLDVIFIRAMHRGGLPANTIERWWNECRRKYWIGQKRDIAKWGMKELAEQYSAKLHTASLQASARIPDTSHIE